MAESSFPWENIDTTETQFSTMFRTLNNGVNGTPAGDELEVIPGFAGLTVDVEPGQAMVQGHYYINTLAKTITLDTADGANDRIDTIVLRLDDVANTIEAVVVTGTPDSSPVPPTLTQTDPYGVFEFPLADVLVPAAAGVPGTITDRRAFMGARFGVWTTANRPDPGTGVAFGYNSTLDDTEFYDGTQWRSVAPVINELNDIGDVDITSATAGDKLVFDGTNWVNLPGYVYVQTLYYTSSGTFVKANYPWLRAIRVKCQGGGGGGMGCPNTPGRVGSGGGGGGYAESFITDIAGLDASVTVTRGAGGAGGPNSDAVGNNGASSSFGSLVQGNGALGGRRDNFSRSGGDGGGGSGDVVFSGGAGGAGNEAGANPTNNGGSSHLGGAGKSIWPGTGAAYSGQPGLVYGGGGAGAIVRVSAGAVFGGTGADGIVIVELYA